MRFRILEYANQVMKNELTLRVTNSKVKFRNFHLRVNNSKMKNKKFYFQLPPRS